MSASTPFDRIAYARRVLEIEAAALGAVAGRLGDGFDRVAEELFHCRGRVAVAGVGKSADVGQKLVGTLNSTGTRSYSLDPTRAVHGDLARFTRTMSLGFSRTAASRTNSCLLGPLRNLAAGLFAITGNANGTLVRTADAAIVYGAVKEACPLALAPVPARP